MMRLFWLTELNDYGYFSNMRNCNTRWEIILGIATASLLFLQVGFLAGEPIPERRSDLPGDSVSSHIPPQIESVDFPSLDLREEASLFWRGRYFQLVRPGYEQLIPDFHPYLLSYISSFESEEILLNRLRRYAITSSHPLNRLVGPVDAKPRIPQLRLRFSPYFQELASTDTAAVHRAGFNSEAWLNISSHAQVYIRARFENRGELLSQFNGRRWKEKFTGWFDNAALYWQKNGFFGSIGRSYILWGPEQRDALLFSSNSPAFNRIWLGYQREHWRFDYIISRLDDVRHTPDSTLVRYFSAHRLSFRKPGWFEFGISEVALYGGVDRPLEWHYLNPFIPYYWEQWNRRTDDNIFFGLDFVIYWPERSRIFGEVMIDDFQIDFESEPHQVGYKLGIDALEPFGLCRLFTKLSYTRVNTTVYGQNQPQNLWLHFGEPIGYFGGNDQDRVLALFRYHLNQIVDLELELQYNRRGEGRIEQHIKTGVPFEDKFPTGVVEKAPSAKLGVRLFGPDLFDAVIEGRFTKFNDFQHLDDAEEERLDLNFFVTYYLQGLIY